MQAGAAQAHTSAQVLAGLHVATVLDQIIVGPIGVSVIALSAAMLGSRLFPKAFGIVGLLIGGTACLAAVLYAPATASIADALTGVAFLMYIWMIWIGIRLFRARGARASDAVPEQRAAVTV